jgi:MFS family permease
MTATGFLIGAVIAGALVGRGAFHPIDLTIACVLVAALAATVAGVRETPGAPPASGWRELLRSFIPRGPEYRNFYLVLLTRGFVTLGIFSIFTFFQYFLADILNVPDPPAQTGYLIAVIIGAGIPTSLLGGALSDRYGRKPLVYLSGGLMAVASVVFAAVAHRPSLQFLHAVGLVFGLGYGAYQAVDWALAVDVLPRGESAAKDMGIWHVSLVLPQVVAPALTGTILTAFKGTSLLMGYTVVFVLTAAWFILGTVLVSKIRGVR